MLLIESEESDERKKVERGGESKDSVRGDGVNILADPSSLLRAMVTGIKPETKRNETYGILSTLTVVGACGKRLFVGS